MNTNAESPQSVTTQFYYKGFSILLTKRDSDIKVMPLLTDAMTSIDWAIEQGLKPSWNEDTNKQASTPAVRPQNAPKLDKNDCVHEHITTKQSSGRSKPENKGRYYNTCLDCGSFISWQ